ncbi:MAG: prenyltransferase beta subunit [Candidatus Paceibacteria bacterium]|jgi:prenyltransferase beta subunit
MLQVARLAPNLLAEATPKVVAFLEGQLNDDGGGANRAGKSDLYYTAFVLDSLIALRAELPVERVRPFLESFGGGLDLDIVHKACLVRCWTALNQGWPSDTFRADMLADIETHRCEDGGFAMMRGVQHGTLYHAFLAMGVYQDFKAEIPNTAALIESFEGLRTDDGAYGNSLAMKFGTTPSTAAAAALLTQLEWPLAPEVGQWLLAQQHPQGGFKASPETPLPDLLSTGTALHALGALGLNIGKRKEITLDFLDSLWSGEGFYAFWEDDVVDGEYVYYALLALGHLSLDS